MRIVTKSDVCGKLGERRVNSSQLSVVRQVRSVLATDDWLLLTSLIPRSQHFWPAIQLPGVDDIRITDGGVVGRGMTGVER